MRQDSAGSAQHLMSLGHILIFVAVAFFISSPMMMFAPSAATAAPTLRVDAPKHVEVGQPIAIELTAQNAADIAGYELNLLFDPSAAEFDSLRQRKNDLKKFGRDVEPLGAVEMPNGVALGLYSCPLSDCVHGGAKQPKGGNGTVKLATVVLRATQPGDLEITLDAPKFVAADGRAVSLALTTTTVVVGVGSGAAPHPAPSAKWRLRPGAAALPGAIDLTGDRRLTHADVIEAALAWSAARERGDACDPSAAAIGDVNGDGCVDVADPQLLAANMTAGASASAALTFTVDSTGDSADASIGNGACATSGGVCTLRAAIAEANAHAGPDTIAFNIAGSGVQTIQLGNALPTLNDASGPTTIDGYTQPGSSPNGDPAISNAAIRVQIRGAGASSYDGLVITSAGNSVRGLALFNLHRAFRIYGSGASANRIVGNFIGTDAGATFTAPSDTSGAQGVQIGSGAADNQIGGPQPAERNVISGNASHGISLYYEGTERNRMVNNIIGLGPKGDKRLSNLRQGIDINSDASNNVVGGNTPGERNVISGNNWMAVEISHGTLTTGNQVLGNYIGTGVDGTSAANAYAYNSQWGVHFEDGPTNNLVANNVIGNNRLGGIKTENYNTIAEQFANNRIGIGVDGSAIPNGRYGIQIAYHSAHMLIGPGNIITNNPEGIQITGTDVDFNTMTQNAIYNNKDASGNGRGIDLDPLNASGPNQNDAGDTDSASNEGLNYPVLTSATQYQATGTACAEAVVPKPCTIELFLADRGAGGYGQGRGFLGAAQTKPDGSFSVVLSSAVAVGSYVTATATDAQGNTSEFSANRQVAAGGPVATPTATAAPGGPIVYADDSFGRQATDGWGMAEVGGAYALESDSRPDVDYDVNGAAGTIATAAGAWHSAYLSSVSALDVDISMRVSADKVASGGYQFVYLVARQVSLGETYLGRMQFHPSGSVLLQAGRSTTSKTITMLGTEVSTGLRQAANGFIWMRMQAVGANPTTIRLKAWNDGQAEPASWQYSVADATASLQSAGAIGLRTYISSAATNAPVVFSFDNFRATGLASSPPPSATPTSTPSATPSGSTATSTSTPSATPTSTPSATPSGSTATPTSTPGGGIIYTFSSKADTYVSQASPTSGYGGSSSFSIVGGTTTAKQGFIRFSVGGLPTGAAVRAAKLRLYVTNDSTGGGTFTRVSNTTWDESITWNTKPAIDGAQIATLGSVGINSTIEIDLTGIVTGNGEYSFAITLPSTNTNTVGYASKEAGTASQRPQLILQT